MEKSAERVEFLSDILGEVTGAGSYGFFYLIEEENVGTAEHYALIIPKEDAVDDNGFPLETFPQDKALRVTLDTVATGIGVIQRAKLRDTPEVTRNGYTHPSESVLHNVRTGERLYLSQDHQRAIRGASFANDAAGSDDGDLDIIHYLAILECGLFGKVVYA